MTYIKTILWIIALPIIAPIIIIVVFLHYTLGEGGYDFAMRNKRGRDEPD